MHRLLPFLVCVLLLGCDDPSAKAPMLSLEVQRENGTSATIGRHRVFQTGRISESADRNSKGEGVSQTVTVDEIADDGVTLTFQITEMSGEAWEKQILVPYGQQTSVDLPDNQTLVASLERRK